MTTKSSPEYFPIDLIPVELRHSTGFIIHFPKEFHAYRKLYSELPLKENLKEFLVDVLQLMEPDLQYCSFDQISSYLKAHGKPYGKTMIYDRIKNLTGAHLCQERLFKRNEKARRAKILIINSPILNTSEIGVEYLESSESSFLIKDKRQEAEKQRDLLKSQFEDQMLDGISNRSFRDMMMSSMLAKCIRLDSKDERKKLVTNFQYKNTPVDVTTTTLSDGDIAISSDIRYTMVITTFCLKIMEDFLNKHGDINKKPQNLFLIDLSEVCTHIGNKRTTGNRFTAYKSTKRLFQTNFEIKTPQESEFAERFLEGYNEANYRFLSDFRAVIHKSVETDDLFSEDEGNELEDIPNPRWIRISLWPASFDSMWDQVVARYRQADKTQYVNYFVQNPAVVKNQAPLAYHLFSHLSSWVGVVGNQKKRCSTSNLYQYMLKTSKYQNFVRSLIGLFKGLQKEDEKPITINTKSFKVNFYGYWIEGRALTKEEQKKDSNRKGFFLTFYRDKEDPYIGDKSRHHQLRAKTSKENDNESGDGYLAANNKPANKNRVLFKELCEELGKDPDDSDISTASVITVDEDGKTVIESDSLF